MIGDMTPVEMLSYGLALALTAPTDEQCDQAVALCNLIAVGLTDEQVQQAKSDAIERTKK